MATANVSQGLRGPAAVAKTITGWFIAMAVLFIILRGYWQSSNRGLQDWQ